MSILQNPEAINAQNLQIWNNAAFDDAGGSSDRASRRLSSSPLQPISVNPAESLDLDASKENRGPAFPGSPVAKKSLVPPTKPLSPTGVAGKPSPKVAFKEEALTDDGNIDDAIKEIEREIRRLSSRLEELKIKKAERDAGAAASGRRGRVVPAKFLEPKPGSAKNLETPASRKIEETPASARSRQRGLSLGPLEIGASLTKLADPKQRPTKNVGSSSALKKIEETPTSTKTQRRGVSLGPLEIHGNLRQLGMAGGTPLRSVQRQRRLGVGKLEGIEEEKEAKKGRGMSPDPSSRLSAAAKAPEARKGVTNAIGSKKVAESPSNARLQQRGVGLGSSKTAASVQSCQPNKLQQLKEKGSLSVSPKSRKPSIAKFSDLRKGIATVGVKKSAKRENELLKSFNPKALFQEGKNNVPSERPSKKTRARVVASRYSLASTRAVAGEPGSKRRKWSLPESGREESNGSLGSSCCGSMSESNRSRELESDEQMKRDWEMLGEAQGEESHHSLSPEKSPPSIVKIAEMLPKIKTLRCTGESPRDSGRAKRVSELVGRTPFF